MIYKGTLYIDNVKVPTPQTYNWSKEDIDGEEGTGRDNEGEMFRHRIATKRKLSFTWGVLSIADTSKLLKALEPKFITVRYLDAYTGDYETRIFYAGPQSADCGHRNRWLGISANLIEK